MNILVIVADTVRRDQLGCYGGSAGTPCLDALAAESVVFDQAYAASIPTLPCRAELFTGRIIFPYLDWGPLPQSESLLSEAFCDARYHCAMVSDNLPLGNRNYGYDRGFHTRIRIRGQWYDPATPLNGELPWPAPKEKLGSNARVQQYLHNVADRQSEEDYFAPRTVNAACRWLEDNARHGPFFLWVDIFDPHEPWDPPASYLQPGEEDVPWILYPQFGFADRYPENELSGIRSLYRGEVRMMDRWVGRLLQRVDDLGLRDDTVVVFLSDHGIFLGEHNLLGKASKATNDLRGWPPYGELSRVPMMIRVPGQAPGRREAFVHPGDLAPTLLQLAGVKVPPAMHARSLVPLVRGEGGGREIAVSSWSLRRWRTTRPSVVRDGEWSMVFWRSGIRPELHHRATDPGETEDVAAKHPAEVKRLHREYVRFLQQNDAPPEHLFPRRWLVSWSVPNDPKPARQPSRQPAPKGGA